MAELSTGYTQAAPGAASCQQTQRLVLPANTWTTIAQGAGAGAITKVWFAVDANGGSGNTVSQARIRITFDGAPVPQIGGVAGMPLDAFVGAGFNASPVYRTNVWGQSIYSPPNQMSGYNNMVMPYSAGYKVELLPYGTGNNICWSNVETEPVAALPVGAAPPAGYRLNAIFSATTSVAPGVEQTLLQTTRPTILLGVLHYFSGETDLHFLEGDQRIYYGGSGTAAYRSSGSEDFFQSSYYFTDGYTHNDEAGLVYKDSSGDICAYRLWPLSKAPASPTGLQLTWANGDATYNTPTQNTNSTPVLFYYMK